MPYIAFRYRKSVKYTSVIQKINFEPKHELTEVNEYNKKEFTVGSICQTIILN